MRRKQLVVVVVRSADSAALIAWLQRRIEARKARGASTHGEASRREPWTSQQGGAA